MAIKYSQTAQPDVCAEMEISPVSNSCVPLMEAPAMHLVIPITTHLIDIIMTSKEHVNMSSLNHVQAQSFLSLSLT